MMTPTLSTYTYCQASVVLSYVSNIQSINYMHSVTVVNWSSTFADNIGCTIKKLDIPVRPSDPGDRMPCTFVRLDEVELGSRGLLVWPYNQIFAVSVRLIQSRCCIT